MKKHVDWMECMKAAIFDMDGTVLDSMEQWRSLSVLFLEKRGIEVSNELREALRQMSGVMAAKLYLKRFGMKVNTQAIMDEYLTHMERCYMTEIGLKPGIRAYLERLHAQGIPCCIATATPQEMAVRALDRHGLTPFFRFVVGTREERRGKDDPVFFELTASRLGVTAAECTVFEDALYAMQGAKKAGCTVIGVEDGTNQADRAEMMRLCDRVISDYAQM